LVFLASFIIAVVFGFVALNAASSAAGTYTALKDFDRWEAGYEAQLRRLES
jgi:hypothetical protein